MTKAWDAPVEVNIDDMRTRFAIQKEKYAFYCDVLMRLEQTRSSKAIRYTFADAKTAEAYRTYVTCRMRDDYGKGQVLTRVQQNGTSTYVFITRGKNYGQSPNGKS